MDINTLPMTRNADLVLLERPKVLTLEQFNELPVSAAEMSVRNQIYALEEYIFAHEDSWDDIEMEEEGLRPIHRFVNGLYHRELTIPPDRVVVGKRHAIEHIVMLTVGSCWCVTERGKEFMTAPMTFISPAGEKRVVITTPEQGCTWVTLHPTNKTDLKDIEEETIITETERKKYLDMIHKQGKEIKMNTLEMIEVAS